MNNNSCYPTALESEIPAKRKRERDYGSKKYTYTHQLVVGISMMKSPIHEGSDNMWQCSTGYPTPHHFHLYLNLCEQNENLPVCFLQLLQASTELMEVGSTSSDWWPLVHHYTGDPLTADSTGRATVKLELQRRVTPDLKYYKFLFTC